jgi:NAD(P)-dependent dehydrogenase (short-subunit alcohol dehydrogenase family)
MPNPPRTRDYRYDRGWAEKSPVAQCAHAMGRFGHVEEVATTVASLASDDASTRG